MRVGRRLARRLQMAAAMDTRVEQSESQARTSRSGVAVFAICDGEPGRLEDSCRGLPNGRNAALVLFDCASAIDAAFKGVIDVLVVDWNRCTPERLTALNFLRRERSRIRIYFVMDTAQGAPHLVPWSSEC